MIRQAFRVCAVAAVLGTAAACTSLNVKSDVSTSLAGGVPCRTFAWAGAFRGNSPLRSTVASPLNEGRLRAAIAANLTAVGLQPTEANADCLVGYGIGAHNMLEGGGYYGWGWGPYPWGWDTPYVYREGIVAVDLYDAKTRQPLWHASVDQSVSGLTGAAAEKKIREAIDAIFTKYPGKPAQATGKA